MRHLQQLLYIDAVARTGSIRRAAQSLSITSTALNRRILSVEEDLGTPIFERTGKGVRLSVAGEVFIHHVRQQLADMEKVKSRIADLQGERRGVVSIACGQALMHSVLPQLVAAYRTEHPYVDFRVSVCGRHEAADRLMDFSADLAVIFEPDITAEMQVLMKVPQDVYAVMSGSHPLADKKQLTISDCASFPLALPSRRSGLRALIEKASGKLGIRLWAALESDSMEFLNTDLGDDRLMSFQIAMATAKPAMRTGQVAIKVSTRELATGSMVVLQQKGRTLPVAAARFLDQLTAILDMTAVAKNPVRNTPSGQASPA